MKKKAKKVVSKNKTKKVAKKSKASVAKSPVAGKSTARSVGVTPLSDRVLVRPLSPEEMGTTTSFGIIIPDSVGNKEKPEQGIVVAVGVGKLLDDGSVRPVDVEVGNRVLFSKYGYDEVKVGGVEYFIVAEQNILAVIS